PITVPALYLKPNYLGLLVYTVVGLDTNATYNFEVQVKNLKTAGYSQATAQKSATTFANVTANFLGIQNVKTMPGLAGITSVKVEWVEAEKQGSAYVPKDIDPKKYVVELVDASFLSPGDLHNAGYSEPQRKIVYVNSGEINTVVGGLQGDTLYYVSVRCIHVGYTKYGSDINYKKEVNSKYMEVRTLKGGINNIDFNTEGVTVALMPGTQGLTSVSAQWEEAAGAFDSYRVFYSTSAAIESYLAGTVDGVCDGQETANPSYYCKQVDYLTTSAILIDMLPNTNYKVVVVVCQSATCAVGTRVLSSVKTIVTTPPVATYAGVTSILKAREFNKLDELYLQVTPPDLSSGIMDGVIVEYTNYLGSVIVPLNHPQPLSYPNISPLSILSFNFQSATELVVTGVYPFSSDAYCFRAFPYTWESGKVVKHDETAIAFCVTPEVKAPTVEQFAGVTDPCLPGTAPGGLLISWEKPSSGVYSHFEILIRPEGSFDFGTATSSDPPPAPYIRRLVSENLTSYTVEGLISGQQYRVGVLTYVNVNGTIKRSDFNNVTSVCTPD
ncbi:MAG: fibronectin type III domain-containing protein, partial [Bdellovibrionota bacterium]